MPGRQLQLSLQQLSLPQAPHPEAWLEARWHGCSALAACKWIAAPPAPLLITLSPGLRHLGLPPLAVCAHTAFVMVPVAP